jgi:hypothetical protein
MEVSNMEQTFHIQLMKHIEGGQRLVKQLFNIKTRYNAWNDHTDKLLKGLTSEGRKESLEQGDGADKALKKRCWHKKAKSEVTPQPCESTTIDIPSDIA